jgi:hypothetical protein
MRVDVEGNMEKPSHVDGDTFAKMKGKPAVIALGEKYL